jgi:protein farnesyltransferase/geranylgeranyltransferase type-1 subunit alpha
VFGHEELEELEKPDGEAKSRVRKELLENMMLGEVDEVVLQRELSFTKGWIEAAPQNASPWNYLRGVLKRAGRGLGTEREFCESFVRPKREGVEWQGITEEAGPLDFEGDGVRSSHAIDWLSIIYAEEGTEEGKEKARACLRALGNKWDIIRKNYWDYRMKSV